MKKHILRGERSWRNRAEDVCMIREVRQAALGVRRGRGRIGHRRGVPAVLRGQVVVHRRFWITIKKNTSSAGERSWRNRGFPRCRCKGRRGLKRSFSAEKPLKRVRSATVLSEESFETRRTVEGAGGRFMLDWAAQENAVTPHLWDCAVCPKRLKTVSPTCAHTRRFS